MPIFTILAYAALLIAVVSFGFAISGRHRLYWVSAAAIYLFSFIAGFSIGQLTVGFTFIPLALAVGFSFGWIRRKVDFLLFAGAGAIIGVIMVFFVDDQWSFLPFWIIGKWFS